MKGRCFPILMLLVAYAIYISHDFIPHHHHHNDNVGHSHGHDHHHSSENHHEDKSEENGLSHLFSHYIHTDGFTITMNHSVFKNFIKQYSSQFALLPFEIHFSKTEIPPLIIYTPPEVSYCISYVARCAGLRAPPFYIA